MYNYNGSLSVLGGILSPKVLIVALGITQKIGRKLLHPTRALRILPIIFCMIVFCQHNTTIVFDEALNQRERIDLVWPTLG